MRHRLASARRHRRVRTQRDPRAPAASSRRRRHRPRVRVGGAAHALHPGRRRGACRRTGGPMMVDSTARTCVRNSWRASPAVSPASCTHGCEHMVKLKIQNSTPRLRLAKIKTQLKSRLFILFLGDNPRATRPADRPAKRLLPSMITSPRRQWSRRAGARRASPGRGRSRARPPSRRPRREGRARSCRCSRPPPPRSSRVRGAC